MFMKRKCMDNTRIIHNISVTHQKTVNNIHGMPSQSLESVFTDSIYLTS